MKTIHKIMMIGIFLMNVLTNASGQAFSTPDESRNYIQSIEPAVAVTSLSGITNDKIVESISYSDGVGRIIQTMEVGASPNGDDIVSASILDGLGRVIESMLPSIGNGNGTYTDRASLISNSAEAYGNDTNPFESYSYEDRTIYRQTGHYGAGQKWRSASRQTSYAYGINGTSIFKATGSRDNPVLTPVSSGYAIVSTMTDEDGRIRMELHDSQGRLVLSRLKYGAELYDTFYAYDDYGNLCFVLPPEGTASWRSGDREGALEKYAYCYRYDNRNRCTAKKFPGAGWAHYIHDHSDRTIFTQSSNQAIINPQEWNFTLYDVKGRPCVKGVYKGDASEVDVSNRVVTVSESGSSYMIPEYIPSSCVTIEETIFYDSYTGAVTSIFSGSSGMGYTSRTGYDSAPSDNVKGLVTGRTITTADHSETYHEVYYYDSKGRLIQTKRSGTDGTKGTLSAKYDFRGKKERMYESAKVNGSVEHWIEKAWIYNKDEQPSNMMVKSSFSNQVVYTYGYDSLGRLNEVQYGRLTEKYSYNIRGWQTGKLIYLGSNTNPFFAWTLRYESPMRSSGIAQYGGNISEVEWLRGTNAILGYAYQYDSLSRVSSSVYLQNGQPVPEFFTESDITYDRNGNILTMKRHANQTLVSDICNIYDGNHLADCVYDANGNMLYDPSTGTEYEWNRLDLLKKVTSGNGTLVNYSYLADGTKISALDEEGNGLLYRGSLTFRKSGNSVALEGICFEGGRFIPASATQHVPMFHLTDHLGSVTAVVCGSDYAVTETSGYLPFGSRWAQSANSSYPANRHRYNGKEEQSGEFGLATIDYGARHYSPAAGRWLSMDPLAEKYCSVSPYAFCNNNPVNLMDPDGRRLYFAGNVSDKFRQQFAEMIKFMNSKGTSGDIAQLHSSDTIYYIEETGVGKDRWNHFNPDTRTILWDPNTIYESPANILVSPATTLAHEAAHAVRYDNALNSNDPDVWLDYIRSLQKDSTNEYRSREEEIVITTTEQSAARKHREIREDQVTRNSHNNGKLIRIDTDLSPEDLSKSIFEHNNLF